MRARILQWDGAAGKGMISSEGVQHPFALAQWRSDTPPEAGQTVDVTIADGKVTELRLVSSDVLAKEMASNVASNLAARGDVVRKNLLAALGLPVVVGYAVFILAAVGLDFITIKSFVVFHTTLFNASEALQKMGAGGGGQALLIAAFLSFLVPMFWRDAKAWYALCTPAAVLLFAWYKVHSAMNAAMEQLNGMFGALGGQPGRMSAQMADAASKMITIEIGLYVTVAAALYLAGSGVWRALRLRN